MDHSASESQTSSTDEGKVIKASEVRLGDEVRINLRSNRGVARTVAGVVGRITSAGSLYTPHGGILLHPASARDALIYLVRREAWVPPNEDRIIRIKAARRTSENSLRGDMGLFKFWKDRKLWNNWNGVQVATADILEWNYVEVINVVQTRTSASHDDTHDDTRDDV